MDGKGSFLWFLASAPISGACDAGAWRNGHCALALFARMAMEISVSTPVSELCCVDDGDDFYFNLKLRIQERRDSDPCGCGLILLCEVFALGRRYLSCVGTVHVFDIHVDFYDIFDSRPSVFQLLYDMPKGYVRLFTRIFGNVAVACSP